MVHSARRPTPVAAAATLAALLALALAPRAARADGGTSALFAQLQAASDPEDCGGLATRCCLKHDKVPTECLGDSLACVLDPSTAQRLVCAACGGEGQPACDKGKRCNEGYEPYRPKDSPLAVCLPKRSAPAATAPAQDNPSGSGGNLDPRDERKLKRIKAIKAAQQAAGLGCSGGAAVCKKDQVCIGGVCLGCGGLGEPCCGGGECRQYDKKGQVRCLADPSGARVCGVPLGDPQAPDAKFLSYTA